MRLCRRHACLGAARQRGRCRGAQLQISSPARDLSAGAEEPNALVQLETGPRTEPNLRATQIELYDGLVRDQRQPLAVAGVRLGAVTACERACSSPASTTRPSCGRNSCGTRVLEPAIRRMAGMGTAPRAPDPDRYDKMHAHCDVLIVRGGSRGADGRARGFARRRARHRVRRAG
jgi:sarcosine oxidase subunit alpha